MHTSSGARLILLVDDDPNITRTLGMRLRSVGYKVITASDGDEALNMALHELPDLIILDVNLPKRLGFSVCRMFKLDQRTKKTPVLMLTARRLDADYRLGALTGADAYMTKPFQTDELLQTVENLLAAAAR